MKRRHLQILLALLASSSAMTRLEAGCVDCGGPAPSVLAFLQSPEPPASQLRDLPAPPNARRAPAQDQSGKKQGKGPFRPKADVASAQGCLAIAQMADRDGDFARNAEALSDPVLCMKKKVFSEGSLNWTFQTIVNKESPGGYLWFVPHDDENVAFDTAVYGVRTYGGIVISVETGGQRFNGPQDPNRNFDAGLNFPKCAQQVARSPVFTRNVLQYLTDDMSVIALHSNRPGPTISMSHSGDGNARFPARAPLRTMSNDDTMVFVASTAGPSRDGGLRSFVRKLNEGGLNVIYETVSSNRNDCSMSNYAALSGIRDYVNLEVVHGDRAGQRAMLDRIIPMLEPGIGQAGDGGAPPDAIASETPGGGGPQSAAAKDAPANAADANVAPGARQEPQPAGRPNNPGVLTRLMDAISPAADPPRGDAPRNEGRPQAAVNGRSAPEPAASAAPARPADAKSGGRVTVQLASRNTEQEADRELQDLQKKLGLTDGDLRIRPGRANNAPVYRIFYGEFRGVSEARQWCISRNRPDNLCQPVNQPRPAQAPR